MKTYPQWTFTNPVGLGSLILGVGFVASGLQDAGTPVEGYIALGLGILMLVANPVCYMIYRNGK